MDVKDRRKKFLLEKDQMIALYNPLPRDFICEFIYDGVKSEYTVPAKDMGEFVMPVARHIRKQLANEVLNFREVGLRSDKDYQAVYGEIDVEPNRFN